MRRTGPAPEEHGEIPFLVRLVAATRTAATAPHTTQIRVAVGRAWCRHVLLRPAGSLRSGVKGRNRDRSSNRRRDAISREPMPHVQITPGDPNVRTWKSGRSGEVEK